MQRCTRIKMAPNLSSLASHVDAEAQFSTDQDLLENEASERMLQPRPGSVVVVTRHEESWKRGFSFFWACW